MQELINWSALSRRVIGYDDGIRPKNIPKKHQKKILKIFDEELPNYIRTVINKKKPEQ
jgi:hypothetical protein